uniref:Uncharacterized protein n=2 Tax=Vibrio TaxID=662 RepID=A0A0H3ZKC6_9VIBR|nr:hypothetical protein [Vibrio tasmaniensis]AKN37150.1 hypothetical protein [Vibrio genomosp. F6]
MHNKARQSDVLLSTCFYAIKHSHKNKFRFIRSCLRRYVAQLK